jgi:hypothetical protein
VRNGVKKRGQDGIKLWALVAFLRALLSNEKGHELFLPSVKAVSHVA